MIPIKFRGRVPADDKIHGGKIVFGALLIYNDMHWTHWIYTPDFNEPNYPVEPESVAQLVGYDADGREVYDGDEVRSQRDGKIYKAEFQRVIVRQKPYHEIIDYDIDRSTLIKEAK